MHIICSSQRPKPVKPRFGDKSVLGLTSEI